MGFFLNEVKGDARPARKTAGTGRKGASQGHIPVQAMQQLGCRACPLGGDPTHCHNPQLEPEGPNGPEVFVLWSAPTEAEDSKGRWGLGRAADAVMGAMKRQQLRAMQGGITRCMPLSTEIGVDASPALNEIECCRGYVTRHIEEAKPLVVATVGDSALRWATGLDGSTLAFRGTPMPGRFGNHVCWIVPLGFPKFAFRNSKKVSEYELALRHDVGIIRDLVEAGGQPEFHNHGFDNGVELITGQEPGDFNRLEDALNDLAKLPSVGLDYETNDLRPRRREDPAIWTAAVGSFDRVVAFAMDHPDGWGTKERIRRVRGLFGDFMMSSGRKIAHNLAFELEWTEYFWGDSPLRLTEWADTMAQCYVLDEREGTKGLGVQTRLSFGFDVKKQSNIDTKRLLDYPIKQVLRYNGMDSKWTHRLDSVLMPRLRADPRLLEVYERKIRLAPTLVTTSAKGVPVDRGFAERYLDELVERNKIIAAKIGRCPEVVEYGKRFGRFEPTNPDHMLKMLDVICKRDEIRVENWDGSVRMTSDEDALSKITASEVPSAPLVLEHRGLEKLVGTYLSPLASGKVIGNDGRVHPAFGQLKAVTGRLNCEDPNLQNIPVRTAEGKRIREAFLAEGSGWIAAIDYGQIEARVIGMASLDERLMKYQWTDYDIHGDWAKRIHGAYPKVVDWVVKTFKIDWDEKGMKTLRQEAKNKWVFPQFFGSAARSCAANLHLPEDVADELAAEFWDEFPGVRKWQEKQLALYEKRLYVETLGGQRRRGAMTKNEIINMPIQGTAAEIVTGAMAEVSELAFTEGDPELQPNLNIHDDLTFWLSDATLENKVERICRIMCFHRFDYICVPLIVEVKVGKTWNKMEEVAVYKSDQLYNLRNPYK